ncbi:MAG: protein kinase, partial [Acidobacteriota bacterium]
MASEMVGRKLGHYEVLAKLGEGGMGEVYRAEDTTLARQVALKVLPAAVASDPDRLSRFEREAKVLAALVHPNIVTIFSVEKSGGVLFLTMELVEGRTLSQLISKGGMPIARFFELAIPLADALAAAHERGIIHRDLKPGNVMVSDDGRVKILDFGLAKLKREELSVDSSQMQTEPLTEPGLVVGTLSYMSPEQLEGKDLDARSDIFSLGCLMYEMLAGRRPFRGDSTAGRLAALLRDEPPPLTGYNPTVAGLIERCLRKDVNQRIQSAAELKSALEAALESPTEPDQPSVAVFPFVNMSGVEGDEYLCEGLAEEIINVLTRIPGLRVIARTSSFVVGRMELDVREAGAKLGVGTILEGSVRHVGTQVRITAQLVDTSDGSHLWSERFERELTDVFALEDELAEAIANRLRVGLNERERERTRQEPDLEAHRLFLEGRYYFARGTPEALGRAKECFERALDRDPAFAVAYDSLAELYWYLGLFGAAPPQEAFSQSTWHALHALELDESLAETHALLGMLRKELDYNWPEVERENRRARDLNRDSPLVRLRYAISGLLPHGHMDEALVEVEAALRSDPLSLFVRWWYAAMAYLGRRLDLLAEEGQHMVALDPTHVLGHWVVAIASSERGADDEALAEFEKAHQLSGEVPFTMGYLAYANGRAGRTEAVLELLEQAKAFAAEAYMPPSTLALGYVGLDDWGNA